ncbi:hypothetical protein B4102_0234 [Heyndrickxia sporothermodurans]|uniref:Minor tail protein Z n=1 Tax=Heyndrickxia sporothermodurans TaxID=46224 RepID=A0A150KS46_9BACI|nr:phage tail protein [Heyndrickxia sporothermodurans]KYD02640.1 hypothetical protein B4102_0234 [Heyndrickxia sporothermodurans]
MIELKLEHIERLQKMLGDTPKQIPIVTARAINRSAEAARTQAAKSARQTYIIKHKDIISTIRIKKATPNSLFADIRSRGFVIKLINFKVNPGRPQPNRKRPITASVKRGSEKTIKNGFVAQMRSGHINVFTRVSKRRFPIKGHYGPSVPQMLGNKSVEQAVEERAEVILDKRLDHEINRLFGGS